MRGAQRLVELHPRHPARWGIIRSTALNRDQLRPQSLGCLANSAAVDDEITG